MVDWILGKVENGVGSSLGVTLIMAELNHHPDMLEHFSVGGGVLCIFNQGPCCSPALF